MCVCGGGVKIGTTKLPRGAQCRALPPGELNGMIPVELPIYFAVHNNAPFSHNLTKLVTNTYMQPKTIPLWLVK